MFYILASFWGARLVFLLLRLTSLVSVLISLFLWGNIVLTTHPNFYWNPVAKDDEASQSIPVIAKSASAMNSDIQRGLAAGFKEYLAKPIDIENMLASIDDLI